MSIKFNKYWVMLLIASALILLGVAEFLAVISGAIPRARVHLNLVVPLYPYNYTYVYTVSVLLGRGEYKVSLKPYIPMEICLVCDNQILSINASMMNSSRTTTLHCSNGLYVIIRAHVKAYSTSAGELVVARRWR